MTTGIKSRQALSSHHSTINMTRTSHKAHPTPAFPVYAVDWADDETLILAGGGGATKSGIKNKLVCSRRPAVRACVNVTETLQSGQGWSKGESYFGDRVEQRRGCSHDTSGGSTGKSALHLRAELMEQSKQLVTGINASSSLVKEGKNDQCRLYSYADDSIQLKKAVGTIEANWSDDYPYQVSLKRCGRVSDVVETYGHLAYCRFSRCGNYKRPSLRARLPFFGIGGINDQPG